MKHFFILLAFSSFLVLLNFQISCAKCSSRARRASVLDSIYGKSSGSDSIPDDVKNFLPPNYNKLEIPIHRLDDANETIVPVRVAVSLMIFKVLEINEKNEELVLDTDFALRWGDWNILKYYAQNNWTDPNTKEAIKDRLLDSSILEYIWKPDVFLDEMTEVQSNAILSQVNSINFLGQARERLSLGDIFYSQRLQFKVECEMDFRFYPADTQECTIFIRSYSHTHDQLQLYWGAGYPVFVYLDDPSNANYDVQISTAEPNSTFHWEPAYPSFHKTLWIEESFNHFRSGNYSALSFTIKVRRKLSYHIVQTYLPSVLLILMTWLCFLIPSDMVEARIGISMTAVLTLTAMFAAVRGQSPEVSYTMAIDIWMVFCIFSVFLALLLFTSTYWFRLQLKRRQRLLRKREQKENVKDKSGHSSGEDSDIDELGEEDYMQRNMLDKYHRIYTRLVRFTEHQAFWLFSVTFILFVICYWVWLMKWSQYNNWKPVTKFNNIDDQDPETWYKVHSSGESESTGWIVDEVAKLLNMNATLLKKLHASLVGDFDAYHDDSEL